jgi:dihydrofolate reductase
MMRRLIVFNNVSVDGFFTDTKGDFSWAHAGSDDPEYASFVSENAKGDGELLFGRVTYQLMAGYWPTPMAAKNNPEVAEGMNRMPKVVFSRTLDTASWQNTRLLKGDLISEVRKLKDEAGPGMAILGSGKIVAQLAAAGLIDEFHIVVNPLALSQGRSMFDGVEKKLPLKLTSSRAFKNGKVSLTYEAA